MEPPPRSHSETVAAVAEPSGPPVRSKPQRIAGLAIVATPIGNADDITLRALAALAAADVIACEDTRVTAKLLARHEIMTACLPYHDHNAERVRPILIERLKSGESVALVSDAGTPLISDPGYKLVRAAIAEGIPITALPGASAALNALVLSGLPTVRFLFEGFLPAKAAARRARLAELAPLAATLVFLEGPSRLAFSLADMADVLGGRAAAVAREMTKMFEEVRRGVLADLARHYAEAGPPKGEVTVVVAPPAQSTAEISEAELDQMLVAALARASLRDAVECVVRATGVPHRRVYAHALALKPEARAQDGDNDGDDG